jgi:CBS domain containing-hemolysin-like protein
MEISRWIRRQIIDFWFWLAQRRIRSRKDLLKLISNTTVISPADKRLILSAAKFPQVKLVDIMTSKSDITFVRDTIQLGPKVLDELYATGQKIFPVAHKSLDDTIGVIYLEDITIVAKGEQTLSQATHLRPPVLAHSLSANQALTQMMSSNANLALVSDDSGKVVGMIQLQTILRVLLG